MKPLHLLCISVAAGLLPACGGSVNSNPYTVSDPSNPAIFYTPVTLKGTASNGMAIAGANVSAKCLGGSGSASTLPDGTFALSVTGNASLPCILEVATPTNDRKLHAIAIHNDVINLTPLTEMLSTRLMRNPMASVFANPDMDAITRTVTDVSIQMAQVEVGKALVKLVNTGIVDNFYSTPLIAATIANRNGGDAQDKLIDSLNNQLDVNLLEPLLHMLASAKSINDIIAVDNNACLLTGQGGAPVFCGNAGSTASSGKINVFPAAILIAPGGTHSFTADINYPDDITPLRQPVTWSVQEKNGGSISMSGQYTAPATPGVYHILATREDFPLISTTSTIVVDAAKHHFLPTLSVDSRVVKTKPGDKLDLTANINYAPGVFYIRAPLSWSVVEPDGGTITLQGNYTAPQKPGSYHIKVQRDDYPELFAVLDVNVTS